MVIGSHVTTVQRVSGYCLKQDVEVCPYYGVPTHEDMALFAPSILVLCLPMLEDSQFLLRLYPCILWSEQPTHEQLPLVTSPTELYGRMDEIFSNLDQSIPYGQCCRLDTVINTEFVENHPHIGLNSSQ